MREEGTERERERERENAMLLAGVFDKVQASMSPSASEGEGGSSERAIYGEEKEVSIYPAHVRGNVFLYEILGKQIALIYEIIYIPRYLVSSAEGTRARYK